MTQKEKLTGFYYFQYRENAKRQKKKKTYKEEKCEQRCRQLYQELKGVSANYIKKERLEDYHRQVKNLSVYGFLSERPILVMQIRDLLIPELVRLDLLLMKPEEREMLTEKFLQYLRKERSLAICTHTLKSLCDSYSTYGIKQEIIGLVPERPEQEFPDALRKQRKFILHTGPTNCGKTYHSLRRLKEANQGIYLGPLRLLALEVYETMKELRIPCTMITGEECIQEKDSRITAATIEMLDISQEYDVAVIDEAQMIADPERGHSWTRAILGIRADEIHICMSGDAKDVITHLIALCGDSYEIRNYERKTELRCEEKPFRFPQDVRDGDALIVFTKRAVLDLAGRLEKEGVRTSVIYGSLPPEIRRRQIHLFSEKQTGVVVSTDAIGMGLNLPVRRIVFMQTEKFDGQEIRPLKASEVKQIAGRAGRFGLYDRGYVSALGEGALRFIREQAEKENQALQKVTLGFPHVLLDMGEPMNAILKIWKSVEPVSPFEKINIDVILFLYEKAYNVRKEIDGFENKHILFRMLTCSIDIKNKDIISLWLHYCKTYTADSFLEFPSLELCRDIGLMKYETYYKMLDLYHQFSVRLGKNMEQERLERTREQTQDTIMRYLAKNKKSYIRTCKYCGKTLPFGYGFRVCQDCYILDGRTAVLHDRKNGRLSL